MGVMVIFMKAAGYRISETIGVPMKGVNIRLAPDGAVQTLFQWCYTQVPRIESNFLSFTVLQFKRAFIA